MKQAAQDFLTEKTQVISQLTKLSSLAYWQASTTGEEKFATEYSRLRQELLTFLSNREDFIALQNLKGSTQDPILKRQLNLLYNQYLENQTNPVLLKKMVELETEVESIYTKFRASCNGRKISNNEINKILRSETDNNKRREAWEASKQIGPLVADKVIELVHLRNKIARELGFENYHVMALTLSEIEPGWLFQTLEQLKTATDGPFASLKSGLDGELAARYGVSDLMPWHYGDPFFQEAPLLDSLDLDPYLTTKDPVRLATAYYHGIGLEVNDILARSDLYEREGKDQHAFCIDIDREGDIRTLCNLRNDEYWLTTLLHELGHGVYDKYLDAKLPYLLRVYPHISLTEAVAMLMGRLSKNPDWLVEIAGMEREEIAGLQGALQHQLTLAQLIFIRWGLVVVYFERELYANPDQDLNSLWWDLVEKLQLVKRPPQRTGADWAAKIHIATAPAYYQNYILGELTASQLQAALEKEFGTPVPVKHTGVGKFLVERIFSQGSLRHWNELIEKATGETLNPQYFARQFINGNP